MKLDAERLRCNDLGAVRALHEACVRYAKIGSQKMQMGDFADDIAQEMFLKIMTPGFLDEVNPEQEIDGWMVGYAKKAAMGMARKLRWHREYQSEYLDMQPADEPSVEQNAEEAEQAQRAEAAKRALKQREVKSTRSNRRASKQNRQLTRWQQSKRSRPEVREIVTRYRKLGLTQIELARFCGITLNHLRGILYGRIAGNPRAILDALHSLEENTPAGGLPPAGAQVPIAQQMLRWRDRLRLGREPGWHVTLAEALGVHRSTMYRWKTGKAQPLPHLVRFLDTCVEAHVKRIAAQQTQTAEA